MHGYQLMQELDTRSGGRWHPSAGSIYPTLQQLEDEGLVVAETTDGRRTFALTESGKAAASALPTERPWATDAGRSDLRGLTREVGMAALQVTRVGSTEAQAQAQAILVAARRDLYRLLADEPTAATRSRRPPRPPTRTRTRDAATSDLGPDRTAQTSAMIPTPASAVSTRPIRQAWTPAALSARTVSSTSRASTAASSPPDVCGSWASVTSAGVDAVRRRSAPAARTAGCGPPRRSRPRRPPARAAPGRVGRAPASNTNRVPDALAISSPWPEQPEARHVGRGPRPRARPAPRRRRGSASSSGRSRRRGRSSDVSP